MLKPQIIHRLNKFYIMNYKYESGFINLYENFRSTFFISVTIDPCYL